MRLDEIFDPVPEGYGTEQDDNTALKKSDTRKTRLTLMQLNRLRIMNDVRRLEQEQKVEQVQTQYKPAAASPMM
jgi:hypothetical protein